MPRVAIRLFAVALFVTACPFPASAMPADAQSATQDPVDETAVSPESALSADASGTLTPIRRDSEGPAESTARQRAPSPTSSLALLGLILGGACLALNWLRRRQDGRSVQPQAIDLLASRRLDGQSTLHLVRVGRRVLAVGSSSGGPRTLATIDDPEEIAQLVAASEGRGAPAPSPVRGPSQLHQSPAAGQRETGTADTPPLVLLGGRGRTP